MPTRKHHISQTAPYADTHIHYGQTKADIEEMLKEAGAVALRWTETPNSMRGVELPFLEFILPVKLEGVEKQIGIRIRPPLTEVSRRPKGAGRVIHTANRNGSMRLLYWYIKARIEAARFGLEDLIESFMSKIISELPSGEVKTFGQMVKENPEVISSILPSFEIKPRALTDERQQRRQVIGVRQQEGNE